MRGLCHAEGIERMTHCWLRFRRHRWAWRRGIHGLFAYPFCGRCGWPGGPQRWIPLKVGEAQSGE
jgi:hypothetical protein